MKRIFQIGEKIKLLHSSEMGEVLQLLPNNQVLVLIDDVLEMTLPENEVVSVEPGRQDKLKQTETKVIADEISGESLKNGQFLALDFIGNSQINYYLINHSDSEILFTLYNQTNQLKPVGKLNGLIGARSSQLLFCLPVDHWETHSQLAFQFLFFQTEVDKIPAPIQRVAQIKGRAFLKEKRLNAYLKKECYIFDLNLTDPPTPSLKKSVAQSPLTEGAKVILDNHSQLVETPIDRPETVVDLHIEALINQTAGLENHEIIKIQLDKFESTLSQAVAHGYSRITFIHGIGAGKLKSEVHRRLSASKNVRKYVLENSMPYSGGATTADLK